MAGQRSPRQRRASMRPFAAAQIAELLESRKLLAAVLDGGMLEESAISEEVPAEVVAEEELLCEPIAVELSSDEVVVDEMTVDEAAAEAVAFSQGEVDEQFTPILVVCEFPEELWTRCPVDFDPNAADGSVLYETHDVESMPWIDSMGEPDVAIDELTHAGEWDWSIDYTTVRGIVGDAEYATDDGSEGFEVTDPDVIAKGDWEEVTWTEFVDAGTDSTLELPTDNIVSTEFQPEDHKLWSRDSFLPAVEDYEPQLMLFSTPMEQAFTPVLPPDTEFVPASSLRGGFGVVLRTLTLSVPTDSVSLTSQPLPSNFVPEQRRMESIFAGQVVSAGLSGDLAADSRLIAVRTESRAAAPATATSVVPGRSSRLIDPQSSSAIEEEAAAVEVSDGLDIFGAEGAPRNKKRSQSQQSQSEPIEEIPVPGSESVRATVSQTGRESSESGETSVVSVPGSANVSGLTARNQVPR